MWNHGWEIQRIHGNHTHQMAHFCPIWKSLKWIWTLVAFVPFCPKLLFSFLSPFCLLFLTYICMSVAWVLCWKRKKKLSYTAVSEFLPWPFGFELISTWSCCFHHPLSFGKWFSWWYCCCCCCCCCWSWLLWLWYRLSWKFDVWSIMVAFVLVDDFAWVCMKIKSCMWRLLYVGLWKNERLSC